MTDLADTLLALFERHGADAYSGEAVTQEAHALQCAALAEAEGAAEPLVIAALLHDIGHLIHDAGADVAARGIDARHEAIGAVRLARHFGPAVVEPVRLHVPAKRYLCTVDALYWEGLSPASKRSLELQGGPFSAGEAAAFERQPHALESVRLRRWDDLAKVPDASTRSLEAYRAMIGRVAASAA